MGPFLGLRSGRCPGGPFWGSARLEEGGKNGKHVWPAIEGCPGLGGCWEECFVRDDVSLSFSAAFVLLLCIVRITRDRFQRSFGLHDIIATLSGEGPRVETCNAIFF